MIRYDLQCNRGHEFDGWFSDSAAYDKLVAKKLVECSLCGSTRVEKQLMAPGIAAKANRRSEPSSTMAAGPVDPRMLEMMAKVREIRAHVEQNAEHVGDKFADEARKIHYGETEERGIYGKATPDETKALIEEGIAVHPLPMLPEDSH